MKKFRRKLPATFLFPRTETNFVHRRIHGLRTPDRVNLLGFIGKLGIENDN